MNYPPPAPSSMPSPAPGPEQILNHEIGKSVATGWTLVSNQNGYAILNRGGKVRHLMHGLISLFTCGTWLLGWAIVAILGARQVLTISVDERGLVNRQEPKPRWPYVAAVVAAFVVIGSIAAANGGGGTDTTATDDSSEAAAQGGDVKAEESNAPAKAKEKPKPKAKPIVVSASDLIKEFEASEFTADKKYKGKTLKITGGVVSSIDAQLFDDDKYDVSFDGGGDFEILGIHCRSVANKYLDTLAPGKEVTVTGKFDDGGDLGVEMKSCDF